MPRRGGVRTGTPGKAYSNRSDLNANTGKPLPVQTAPSTEYGQAAASARSQQAVPLAPQSIPAPPVPASPPAAQGPAPGTFGDLLRPTDRPDEPVTAGLSVGAGPGPEVIAPPPDPIITTLANLNSLGDALPAMLRPFVASLHATISNGING